MIGKLVKSIVGSKNDREVRRLSRTVEKINALEADMQALSDEALKAKTTEFKQRLEKGETLDDLLIEAFAAVREASVRTLGLRHFDVQMIGGMVLHSGKIAEMRTGEGKTLVSTLPVYLNALSGKGVHVVTVNDYLAQRDAEWMQPIYNFLGLSIGVVLSGQRGDVKRQAYAADITYGTNNEYGFDYLRDNMVWRLSDRVQRDMHFAIIDEVDSILIDEARTPLIISGPSRDNSDLYLRINPLISKLKPQVPAEDPKEPPLEEGDYKLDEAARQAELTEQGHQLVEDWLIKEGLLAEDDSLYASANLRLLHHVGAALKAHTLFERNVDYIVEQGEVVLIDTQRGRKMPGRRLSEGLHQAIEAKEGVKIQNESQTQASTTFQNYFRIYDKLAGMTGTADTEAFEFRQIYGLDVVVIPTNNPIQRKDLNDLVYLSIDEKYAAAVEEIKECIAKNAPVLVGVGSIESSEEVSQRLRKEKIPHEVLNAKQHEREADIIAQAGRPRAVTIATNMAGRGTDIVLGGSWEAEVAQLEDPSEEQIQAIKTDWKKRHEEVLAAGGLHIICTERNESRRVDNQFRGRAGRQGDPGMSRFFLSMEDNLMRIFASDRMRGFMRSLGMEHGEAIEHRMVTNAIEKAQRKVEGRNFDYRKNVLEFDDVANDQRNAIYRQREEILTEESLEDEVKDIRQDVALNLFERFVPPQSIVEQWNISGLTEGFRREFLIEMPIQEWLDQDENLHEDGLRDRILEAVEAAYRFKYEPHGDRARIAEKEIMLQVLDEHWKEHLANMDQLRQNIGLRGYAGKNPKQEYKRESFEMFERMLDSFNRTFVHALYSVQLRTQEEIDELKRQREEEIARQEALLKMQHQQVDALHPTDETPAAPANKPQNQSQGAAPFVRDGKKVGRNDPCPCGSGKKFKQCHGKLA